MIYIKREFTAGQFDLDYVEIYSNITTELKDTKTGKVYTATHDKPLVIERYRLNNITE